MKESCIINEINDIVIAMELISYGARMQVLESETILSRRKLLRLYKEVKGCSPAKGMLPFSPDWFMSWEQNIHSSLFYNIYLYLHKMEKKRPIESLLKAWRLYKEQCPDEPREKPVFEFTRAWTLLRFIDCGMLEQIPCSNCGGKFISTVRYTNASFTCSLCYPPSRASKKSSVTVELNA
ncbi:flagellar transcriptional activator FlhC [Kosakonia arachidis]|uniref:Flagellar transcriptional regulator FlhC n=1 Tax=Kosakonia arachidis TaxID=551989 RepID=A0A1I7E8P8_9ENTR|nr:flagellar transcriptional regulator FlhC [Kosakonia arachidis]SFU20304.1 flagellar transcriptional activator FlhC [Kosakonia arachidis]